MITVEEMLAIREDVEKMLIAPLAVAHKMAPEATRASDIMALAQGLGRGIITQVKDWGTVFYRTGSAALLTEYARHGGLDPKPFLDEMDAQDRPWGAPSDAVAARHRGFHRTGDPKYP